jgi:hypothetical protein
MSDQALQDWRVDGLSGLAGLTAETLPAFEIIYLDSLAAYVLASGELEAPYTVEHGSRVVAFLLRATVTANGYRPTQAPAPTAGLMSAREAVLVGAHAFAARGRSGLSQLVNRLIPAAVGELELQSASADEQVRSLFRYGLLAVASGPANQLTVAAADGITEIFVAWDGLIGAGFVPPWRVPVQA